MVFMSSIQTSTLVAIDCAFPSLILSNIVFSFELSVILSFNFPITCHIRLPDCEQSVQLTRKLYTCHGRLSGLCAIPPTYITHAL